MKKNATLLLAFLTAACTNTREVTIQDIFVDDDGNEVIVDQTTTTIYEPKTEVVEIEADDTEVIKIPQTVPSVAAPTKYRLQTRSDRYDAQNVAPQIYAIAATRATNKMLDETAEFYENPNGNTFLYITDIKKADRKLPDGVYSAARTTKNIIEGSKTFKVVNQMDEADYYLETIIDNAGTPEEPIFVYKLILFDAKNNKINEWVETIRRVRNDDRSWW